ncbi:MAG: putative membrane protein YfcA [Gammaproteobacteria bacterium]
MPSIDILLLIAAAFFIAGVVKGVIGFGLPTVTLALFATSVGLDEAMVLLLVPCGVTNLWQAVSGGQLFALVKRFWALLLGLATWFGATWHAASDPRWLIGLLGALLCGYSVVSLFTAQIPSPGRYEARASPGIGVVSGVLNGPFVVPGVLYLQSLGLPRDTLIQAMGLLFLTSTIALGVSLRANNLLSGEFAILSCLALLPALIGMAIGLRFRQRLTPPQFRRVFFSALLIFGSYLLLSPLVRL